MKIALLAPLTRAAEIDSRGSRPRIVYDLAKGLVEKGHKVTVFGTGDSNVSGDLIKISPTSIYKMKEAENPFYQHIIYLCRMMDELIKRDEEFDIIHSHLYPEVLPITYTKLLKPPIVVTPHLYMWPELIENFEAHPEVNFMAVSEFQKESAPSVNFKDVVYNGIEVEEFNFNDSPEDYLLFFGRIKEFVEVDGKKTDPKGVTTAIKVAEKLGMKLKIAGNVESADFFDREIKPHLSEKIEFIGPIDSFGPISFEQKVKLYKNAKAFLFPIQHVEAFGMTMLESMACGTPVIGSDIGATSEAIVDGKVGFLVKPDDVNGMAEAVKKIDQIDRNYCRKYVEDNFSAKLMVERYEKVYEKILAQIT
ncbi:MAG: glycosyltransferase family 4 protein [Patescibacteria group bacterium]